MSYTGVKLMFAVPNGLEGSSLYSFCICHNIRLHTTSVNYLNLKSRDNKKSMGNFASTSRTRISRRGRWYARISTLHLRVALSPLRRQTAAPHQFDLSLTLHPPLLSLCTTSASTTPRQTVSSEGWHRLYRIHGAPFPLPASLLDIIVKMILVGTSTAANGIESLFHASTAFQMTLFWNFPSPRLPAPTTLFCLFPFIYFPPKIAFLPKTYMDGAVAGVMSPVVRAPSQPLRVMIGRSKTKTRRRKRKELFFIQMCILGGLLLAVTGLSCLAENTGELPGLLRKCVRRWRCLWTQLYTVYFISAEIPSAVHRTQESSAR